MHDDDDDDALAFSRRELRTLHEMIRDFERTSIRREVTHEWWHDSQKVAYAIAALMLYALNVVVAIYAIRGH